MSKYYINKTTIMNDINKEFGSSQGKTVTDEELVNKFHTAIKQHEGIHNNVYFISTYEAAKSCAAIVSQFKQVEQTVGEEAIRKAVTYALWIKQTCIDFPDLHPSRTNEEITDEVVKTTMEQSHLTRLKSDGSEWISVEEKLHENLKMTEYVLVKIGSDVSPMLHYYDNGLWFHYVAKFHTNGVTEWKRVS